MKSTRHIAGLDAILRQQIVKRASPGERVIASIFPSRGTGYPGFWFSDRLAQVNHYRNWTYVCIDLIARKKASVTANLCYKTDRPVRGATVKACQRALMNLMGGGLGADPYVGQRVTLKSSVADPRTTTAYGNYVGMDGWDRPTVYDAKSGRLVQDGNPTPAVGFSGGGHSWLTMGEWRSKALSVVKPHDNLMPLEHDHPYRRLCENPNPIDTPFDIAYERRMFRGLCGIAYEWTPKNAYGKPCERWVIPSHWVYPRTGAGQYVPFNHEHADELVWDYEIRPWGYPGYAGVLHFPPDEVIVYRDKHPLSKIDGWSKLAAGAQVIDLEEAITQRQWSQLINLGVPGMVVKAPPGYEDWDDNDMARVEAKFWNRIQGAFQHGQSLMVPNGAEVEPWGYNPTEMAFQAAEEQAMNRVCALHGVPKAAFGMGDQMTYGSVMALLGTIHSLVINPELTADGQTETKHLASQFNERAPAYSTMTGGGHGSGASERDVVCFYDDTVPADPQQVNADLALDLQANAVSPNEIRALRGRQPFRRGGDNPIVNGPGGPMPLEINMEERHIDDMVDILAKITSAEGKQTGEQQTESDQASDEARVDSADVRAEATEDQPLADDHGPTGLEPPEKPNGKPSKAYVEEAEGDVYAVQPVKVRDRTVWQVACNGKVTDTFNSRAEAETQVEWYRQRDRDDPAWNRKSLDRLGGEEPGIDASALAANDFITLPRGVTGTNCHVCKFQEGGVCRHPKLDGQPVNERNCCALWDADGTLRDWRKSLQWVHPAVRKQQGESLVRSFPDVRQNNHWRCGAACFAAVCQHYGVEMTVDEASKVLGTNVQHSTDPAAIIRELRRRDIAAQPRKDMTVEQLAECTDAGNPVVVCLQDYGDRREAGASFAYGHYMVTLEASHGIVIFQDPSIENVEREPGGDVRGGSDSGNVAMPGRVVLDAGRLMDVWHDQRANGEKLVRFGIVCGPRTSKGIGLIRKGAGACEAGQTAAQTGCTPASGGSGPSAEATEKPKPAKKPPPGSQLPAETVAKLKEMGVKTFPPHGATNIKVNPKPDDHSAVMTWTQVSEKSGRTSTVSSYTEKFHERNAAEKHDRVVAIAPVIGKIETGLKQRMKDESLTPRQREGAAIASCIRETGLRPTDGSESIKHGHFGISSLQARHIDVIGDEVRLNFIGKEGVRNRSVIRDPDNVAYLKSALEGKGPKDFVFAKANSTDAGKALKELSSAVGGPDDIMVKDLRTLKAHEIARKAITEFGGPPPPMTGNAKKDAKMVKDAILSMATQVSSVLNNQPTESRDTYVDPRIWQQWQSSLLQSA